MNQLQNQVSPYLLQHQNNPVHWLPWGEIAINKAILEDKPIILSIGYAACHWCHVMEHESFEDEQVAELMNQYFICIKVDREERPDIDHIYMDAIHAMGLQGGWPLNVMLMPDQKPFYGGTYFPKTNWMQLLNSIHRAYQDHKVELQKSADGFASNLQDNRVGLYPVDLQEVGPIIPLALERMKAGLDPIFGGTQKAPKFPIPSLGLFFEKLPSKLLSQSGIEMLADLQLKKMAQGGIFDQLGGGFSRYSVDSEWFCPHFEKMLYDNAQLLRVYALAYQRTKNQLYLEVVNQVIDFLSNELLAANGLYYASIDADSEGIEGLFYVWKFEELNSLLPFDKHQAFYQTYGLSKVGNWEHGHNILFKNHEVVNNSYRFELDTLFNARSLRKRPGTDNKQLLAWNAYLALALFESAKSLNSDAILTKAYGLLDAMINQFISKGSRHILHQVTYSDKPIFAFLDDLGAFGMALIHGFQNGGNYDYLLVANDVAKTIKSNHTVQNALYNFHSSANERLIAPKFEITDSVCPAANSMVCEFFMWLGFLNANPTLTIDARNMMAGVLEQVQANPIYFANWLRIYSEWFENPQAIIKYNPSTIERDDITGLGYLCVPIVDLKPFFSVCIGDRCLAPCETIADLKFQLSTI